MQPGYEDLKALIRETKSVLVAFSGGVDSTLLLAAARDALGEKVLAVSAASPTFPAGELAEAQEIAKLLGVRHMVIETDEVEDPDFRANPPNRCYLCKKNLFGKLKKIAARERLEQVLEGSNRDDSKDFRPGIQAARDLGIRSPYIELQLNKKTIRQLARRLGLAVWDKPSSACLASRVPYGTPITVGRLHRIEQAEVALSSLGFRQVRARDHDTLVRIEVGPEEIHRLLDDRLRNRAVDLLKQAGYTYVSLDLQGYRSGAMNESLDSGSRPQAKES